MNKVINNLIGKSAITVRLIAGTFLAIYDPTIEESYKSSMQIGDNVVAFEILDTAGQEDYSAMRENYIRDGDGFVLVYSIISQQSFQEVVQIRDLIYRVLDKDPNNDHIPIVIAGNKCDLKLERKVMTGDVQAKADAWKIKFFETSAKEGINIKELYETVIKDAYEIKKAEEGDTNLSGSTIGSTSGDSGKKTKRCFIL